MKNLRKNKKGFTLIEVIVVLVILAIIIALAVPSVMKYIDDANEAKYLAQARAVYIAADAEIAKDYADDKKINNTVDGSKNLSTRVIEALGTDEFTLKSVTPYTGTNGTGDIDDGSVAASTPTKASEIKSYKVVITADKDITILIAKNGSAKIE